MKGIILVIYIVGAIATHFVIYRNSSLQDIEAETANITCVLWPIVLIVHMMNISFSTIYTMIKCCKYYI